MGGFSIKVLPRLPRPRTQDMMKSPEIAFVVVEISAKLQEDYASRGGVSGRPQGMWVVPKISLHQLRPILYSFVRCCQNNISIGVGKTGYQTFRNKRPDLFGWEVYNPNYLAAH